MKLKPCPFCGSKCGVFLCMNGKWMALCPRCRARIQKTYVYPKGAIKAWNRRVL